MHGASIKFVKILLFGKYVEEIWVLVEIKWI
jgi:hypothetical protein